MQCRRCAGSYRGVTWWKKCLLPDGLRHVVDRPVRSSSLMSPQPENAELVNGSRGKETVHDVWCRWVSREVTARGRPESAEEWARSRTLGLQFRIGRLRYGFMSEQTELQCCRTFYRVSTESREVLLAQVESYLNATVVPTTVPQQRDRQSRE